MQTQTTKMLTSVLFAMGSWRAGNDIDVRKEMAIETYHETSFNRVVNSGEYRSHENQIIFLFLNDESLSTQNNTCHIIGVWFY